MNRILMLYLCDIKNNLKYPFKRHMITAMVNFYLPDFNVKMHQKVFIYSKPKFECQVNVEISARYRSQNSLLRKHTIETISGQYQKESKILFIYYIKAISTCSTVVGALVSQPYSILHNIWFNLRAVNLLHNMYIWFLL